MPESEYFKLWLSDDINRSAGDFQRAANRLRVAVLRRAAGIYVVEKDLQALELYGQGLKIYEIADRFGVDKSIVSRRLKRGRADCARLFYVCFGDKK